MCTPGGCRCFGRARRVHLLAIQTHLRRSSEPYTGIDIHAADVDGDGVMDIVCGAWWYKNPSWERHTIPGVGQIIAAYDLDKDGRTELIGIKAKPGKNDFYNALTSELVWLKPADLSRNLWEEYVIGTGDGRPHGTTIAPILPGGGVALVCGYHDGTHPPQRFLRSPKTRSSLGQSGLSLTSDTSK